MAVNSTSSIERFFIGAGDSRAFVNTDPGSNLWDIDVNGELVQNMDGTVAASNTAVVKLQSAEDSAAVAATHAAFSGVTLTAKVAGAAGNLIAYNVVNAGISHLTLDILVSGSLIVVTPVTDAGGVITSTQAQVKALIDGNAAAAALVSVAVASGATPVVATALAYLAGGVDAGAPGTWADVASVTVNSNGYAILTGATGKYARILNVAGPGVAHIVAKPHRRINPLVALGR